MSIAKEFKAFIMRGNVIDLAVGFVIGAAFGKIVTSLVNDIIMPPIGMIMKGVDFSNLKIVLKSASVDAAGKAVPEVSINYGLFINTLIDFIIVAAAIFLVIKAINRVWKKEQAAPAPPTKQEELLTEIRDVLKEKREV